MIASQWSVLSKVHFFFLKIGLKWWTYAVSKLVWSYREWKARINDTEGKVLNEVKFKMECA